MQDLKIAIVDDDILFAKQFSKIIKEKFPDTIKNLDIFLSAESFLSASILYDILFLDIGMPGVSGLELAKKYKDSSTVIIFVTNKDNLVFEAYNTTKAVGFVRKLNLEEDINAIVSRINHNNQQNRGLSVKSGGVIAKIRYSNIIYIEKVAHNAVIHTTDATYSKRTTISELEGLLLPYGFVKSHSAFLLNLSHIDLINPTSAILSNGAVVPISRNNIKQVKLRFLERIVSDNEQSDK